MVEAFDNNNKVKKKFVRERGGRGEDCVNEKGSKRMIGLHFNSSKFFLIKMDLQL